MDRKPLVVLAIGALAVLGFAIPGASSEPIPRAQAAAEETLELVNIEIDRSGMQFPDKWEITESSARLETDQYSHTHTWSIPSTIPPNGAEATISTSATDKSGGTVSAKTTLFGYVNIDRDQTGVEQTVFADKTNGPATASASKTVTLTPRGGGPPFVTVRVQDGPDVRFNYRIVTDEPPPITPRSEPPAVGALTSYAAPPPLESVALPFPDFGPDVVSAVLTLDLKRRGGGKIDDPGFIAAVQPSDENLGKAATVCVLLALSVNDDGLDAIDTHGGRAFARCVEVVSRILQRAEENRNERAVRTTRAGGCRAVIVRKPGSRARSPLTVSCNRTAAGMRIKMRARKEGRSLADAAGPKPKLIVGRSARTEKKRGDRANVLWKTKE